MQILKSCFAATTAISILSFCNAEEGFYLRKSLYQGEFQHGKFSYDGYDTRTAAMRNIESQKDKPQYKNHFDSEGFDKNNNQYVKNIAKKFEKCNYTEKIMAAGLWDEFDFFNNFYFNRITPIKIYKGEDFKKITDKLSLFLESFASIRINDKDINGLIEGIKKAEESGSLLSARKEELSDAIKMMLPAYFYTLTEISTKALLPEFTLTKKSELKDSSSLGQAIRSLVFSYDGDWYADEYVKSQLDKFFESNRKYIAPFDLFMILKAVQKHNGCPVINWHISRLMQVMHKKGSKYIVDEKKLVDANQIEKPDSFQGNGDKRSILYPQYKNIYDKVTIYADMHKLKNEKISQKVQFTAQYNDVEFKNDKKYSDKRCVTACYPNDEKYDDGGGVMGAVNTMSKNSGQNSIFENKVLVMSNTYPISSKLAAQNPLLTTTKDKNFLVGPHIQAMISNDCDLNCKGTIRKNYGVMWSTSGQEKESLTGDTKKFIPGFYKNTRNYLIRQEKNGRYAMNLIQSVILAINNEYDCFYLGGLAGCGIWNYFDTTYGAKEVASLLKPVLIDLSHMIDKANLDILLSNDKARTTWTQMLQEAWNEVKI